MSGDELVALRRAHELFAAEPTTWKPIDAHGAVRGPDRAHGEMDAHYRDAAGRALIEQTAAGDVDAEFTRIIAAAGRDHRRARLDTAAVLAAALADRPAADVLANPILARELVRRRLHRLHTQRAHVLAARRRARRHRAAMRALHYRLTHHRAATADARAARAVQAALGRLGRPYVWGATGPDSFDCSGLVQWSYAQAGVPLSRTTYDQINEGIPVARADVRPGDLVFPHTGHVQLAIGHGLVVEAPYAGAPVRISPLGAAIAIRRPG